MDEADNPQKCDDLKKRIINSGFPYIQYKNINEMGRKVMRFFHFWVYFYWRTIWLAPNHLCWQVLFCSTIGTLPFILFYWYFATSISTNFLYSIESWWPFMIFYFCDFLYFYRFMSTSQPQSKNILRKEKQIIKGIQMLQEINQKITIIWFKTLPSCTLAQQILSKS